MILTEVFSFADGRTVLTGRVQGFIDWIPPCRCELRVGSDVLAQFDIEGEMMPKRTPGSRNDRVVSTLERVTVDRSELRAERVVLVCFVGDF